jgi:hypothetical protein
MSELFDKICSFKHSMQVFVSGDYFNSLKYPQQIAAIKIELNDLSKRSRHNYSIYVLGPKMHKLWRSCKVPVGTPVDSL